MIIQATRTPGSIFLSKSTLSKSKTLGQVPEETSCSSGYIADASSARTPGLFLHTTQTQDMRKQHTKNGKNFVMQYEKDEEDEEPLFDDEPLNQPESDHGDDNVGKEEKVSSLYLFL